MADVYFEAVENDDIVEVGRLLSESPWLVFSRRNYQLNDRHVSENETALHWACRNGRCSLVAFLLDNGADVDAQTSGTKYSALHFAADAGHDEVVELLLQRTSINVCSSNSTGSTPLHIASSFGRTEIVRSIIDHVAHSKLPIGRDQQPSTPERASYSPDNLPEAPVSASRFVKLVLVDDEAVGENLESDANPTGDEPAGVDNKLRPATPVIDRGFAFSDMHMKSSPEPNESCMTPLQSTAAAPLHTTSPLSQPQPQVAKLVNWLDMEGNAALHVAAMGGHIGCLKLLLKGGANVSLTNADGETALHFASLFGHAEAAALLIKQAKGAVNTPSASNACTPLHYACTAGDEATAAVLLQAGADPTMVDRQQRNSLHMAAQRSLPLARALIARGVSVNDSDASGATPLVSAASVGQTGVMQMLMSTHEAAAGDSESLQRCMHVAAEHNHATTIAQLVSSGCSVNAQDHEGYTPFHVAARHACVDAMTTLHQLGADPFTALPDGGVVTSVDSDWMPALLATMLEASASEADHTRIMSLLSALDPKYKLVHVVAAGIVKWCSATKSKSDASLATATAGIAEARKEIIDLRQDIDALKKDIVDVKEHAEAAALSSSKASSGTSASPAIVWTVNEVKQAFVAATVLFLLGILAYAHLAFTRMY